MSQTGSRITWDSNNGTVKLSHDGKEERVFIISRDFIEQFKEEMIKTAGKSTFKLIMRKLPEKLGKPLAEGSEADWKFFETYNDEQILPATVEGELPKEFGPWDGKTRDLVLLPGINMVIWTVKSFQLFKEVIADIMTEKGANALLNGVGKKAGMAIGESFAKYFGWSDFQNAVDTIDDISGKMSAAAGWGKGSAAVKKGGDGKEMILFKAVGSFESQDISGSRPVCLITASLLNGMWSTFADILGGLAAETREVKCAAKGDDHCAFAIKIKDKDAPHLDWKELESEWQAI